MNILEGLKFFSYKIIQNKANMLFQIENKMMDSLIFPDTTDLENNMFKPNLISQH